MGERSQALADRFEQLNNDLIATVERCTEAEWATKCPDTGWSVAVQAHHVAGGEKSLASFVSMVANGQELPPLTREMIDQGNAKHAEEYANVSKDETVALLRENGAIAADTIRNLSDEQLDRTAVLSIIGKPMSTEHLIHFLSLGEIERHGGNLRQAIGA